VTHADSLAGSQSALVSAAPIALISYDAWGYITSWNPAAVRLLGWEETDVVGLRDPTVAPEDTREFDDVLAVVLRGETVDGIPVQRHDRCGTPRSLSMSLAPLRADDGSITGAVAVLADMTDSKRLEEEKDAFLVAVTHDLKTPLMVVRGIAQFLLRRLRAGERLDSMDLERQLQQIVDTTGNITTSLNSLIDVTRLHMGRPLELERRNADLVALARRVAGEQQSRVRDHQIEVETTETRLVGPWDTFRLERVIGNLISNAIKYSPPGRVLVRVAADRSGWALLSVRDEGIGIPRADVPRIFDRFYRGHNVVGVIPGNGVGLAGVRQIVEQHGGTIDVDSIEGQGTTFVVRLPLNRDDKDSDTASRPANQVGGRSL